MLYLLFLALSLNAFECERAKSSYECYGECGNFIDENSNGICDIWESYHRKDLRKKGDHKAIKEVKVISSENIISTFTPATTTTQIQTQIQMKTKENDWFKRYGFGLILSLNLLLIIISEFLENKISTFILLNFWNWILTLSFLICSITGFLLYFNLFENIKSNFFKLHIQSGIIFFITGFYHFIKRIRTIWPFNKR